MAKGGGSGFWIRCGNEEPDAFGVAVVGGKMKSFGEACVRVGDWHEKFKAIASAILSGKGKSVGLLIKRVCSLG